MFSKITDYKKERLEAFNSEQVKKDKKNKMLVSCHLMFVETATDITRSPERRKTMLRGSAMPDLF